MITVIGDIMLDVFLLSELQEAEQGSGVVLRGGGSAANTAAWLAALRCPVSFVGCVGADPRGRMLVGELDRGGVVSHVRFVDGSETGAVIVEVSGSGERVMRSSRGANESLSPDDIRTEDLAWAEYVHLSGYALLGPFGLELLAAAGARAASAGAILSFDPSSTGVVQRFGEVSLIKALRESGVQLLLPNTEEATALSGHEEVKDAAAALAEHVPTVIVKDGARGAVFSEGRSARRVSTQPLNPIDTTGAGDAFDAGILQSLRGGSSNISACRLAHTCARHVLRRYGGRPDAMARLE